MTFFGQKRDLQPDQSAAWTFNDPATAGSITYTYRIVPQAGLTAAVANQVVSTVAASLPPLPVHVPYVVETLVPLPTLPGVNLPQLPQVNVPLPACRAAPRPGAATGAHRRRCPPQPGPPAAGSRRSRASRARSTPTTTGAGAPQMSPASVAAAAAFDPARFYVPGQQPRWSRPRRSTAGGSGGVAGSYDGASVPVFGQLAGLDGAALDDESAEQAAARRRRPRRRCPRPPWPPSSRSPRSPRRWSARTRRRAPRADASGSARRFAAVVLALPGSGSRRRVERDSGAHRGALWTAPGGGSPHAGSLVLRVPASAGARNACTTLLLQISCSRQDQRRWGSPCGITN